MDLLRRSVEFLRGEGFQTSNVDIVVVTESPRIGPFASEMARVLAGALGIPAGAVSVKGKSNEGMGWIGAGEGLAVHAVALVVDRNPEET